MGKVKLFTHCDLDGVGCAIVGKLAFNDIDIEYCDYHNINDKVKEFLISDDLIEQDYEYVFITDISVNEEVAKKIEFLNNETNISFVLLDHHETAEWLNEYMWATVRTRHAYFGPTRQMVNSSGTSLFFQFLATTLDDWEWDHLKQPLDAVRFVELVRQYDSWDWTRIGNQEPKKWNDLLYIIGRERFLEKVFRAVVSDGNQLKMDAESRLFLSIEEEKIQHYIASSLKNVTIQNIRDHNIGIVFAEQHTSELGHAILNEYPNIHIAAIVNMKSKKISFRARDNEADCGQFAHYFGGGGRPQTAGCELNSSDINRMLELIFHTEV